MIALSVAKLKLFSPKSEISLWIKQKKTFLWKFWISSNVEVREKIGNVFAMSLRLSDHKVLHNIASSSRFRSDFLACLLFSLVFRTSKLLEFKEFNKTIIPFALVGYETGYSQLMHIQRELME